ncbi:cytochrome P450 [Streptomyces sp. NPDC003863]
MDRQIELASLVGEFHQWLTELVGDRSAPEDSFVGASTHHRPSDGELLDPQTAVGACFFAFIAGQSTTGRLIATVLRRTLAEPRVWPRATDEEGLAEAWVEEVLRREPPVTSWRRITTRPVRLGGVELSPGAELSLMLLGSGSDPDVSVAPGDMIPGRASIRHHLAFGVGRHRCPGAALARTEAAVALRAAARHLPAVRLAAAAAQAPTLGLLSFRVPPRVPVVEPPPTA